MQQLAITILTSIGTLTLYKILEWITKHWIGERISRSIQFEYDERIKKIESELRSKNEIMLTQIKSDFERESNKLRISYDVMASQQKLITEKVLSSIDELWNAFLATKSSTPAAISFFDVLRDHEIRNNLKNPSYKKLLSDLSGSTIFDLMEKGYTNQERIRPYVGEYIWSIYSSYQLVIIRALLIINRRLNGDESDLWHNDKLINGFIKAVFDLDEYNEWSSLEYGKYQHMNKKFERKLLDAIALIRSGSMIESEFVNKMQAVENQIRQFNEENISRKIGEIMA